MILIDAANWIDHIRAADTRLSQLVTDQQVLMHPLVLGEIAMGSMKDRSKLLERLARLPVAVVARNSDVMILVEREKLYSTGLSFLDAHLLAATMLTLGARLLSADKRLRAHAERLAVAATI